MSAGSYAAKAGAPGWALSTLGRGDMLVIAYRGVSFYAPENFIVVFDLALQR
jgi:hypothetical protein